MVLRGNGDGFARQVEWIYAATGMDLRGNWIVLRGKKNGPVPRPVPRCCCAAKRGQAGERKFDEDVTAQRTRHVDLTRGDVVATQTTPRRPGQPLRRTPAECTLQYPPYRTLDRRYLMSMPTRRDFVSSTAALFGGGWLWLQLPALASISACARDAARRNDAFATLSPGEGRAMRAFAARIIPSGDGLPGADEAGAAWFADGALGGPLAGMRELVAAGLADLDARAEAAHGAVFADATPEQQDAIMRDIEDQPFFFVGRLLTVLGTFSDPVHGGNRNHAGFALLEMEHAAAYQPPFGWYDEQHARDRAASGGVS